MTAALIPTPVMQFLDADGNPLVGGKLYTYAAGTSTPLATYTDYGGATPNANPVILNSRGEASIWFGTAAYKLELYTAANVLIWTADNVSASTPVVYGTGVAAALAINVGTAGSILVNGGVLGTPSSGLVTNLTGTASININGTVGATTANTGAFTTLSASGTATFGAGSDTDVVIKALNSFPTFNAISMNGSSSLGTMLGWYGGATGVGDLYANVPTGGSHYLGFAGSSGEFRLQSTGLTLGGTLSVTGTSTMAAINASGNISINSGVILLTAATGAINTAGALTLAPASANPQITLTDVTKGSGYIQGGVNTGGTGAGDYWMFNVPTSRGLSWSVNNVSVLNALAAGVTIPGTLGVTGVVTMSNYGAGTATFSAAGVISSVSDERLKIKDGTIADPIPMMMALEPGYYFGKPEANMGDGRQLGFYAQNVRKAIGPEAAPDPEDQVSLDADGNEVSRTTRPWGYYDRSVLAVAIEALKVHEGRLAAMQADFEAYKTSHP